MSYIAPSVYVSEYAHIRGHADLRHYRHLLAAGPLGSGYRTATIHRHYDGPDSTQWGHLVVAECWQGTLDELAERIAGTPGEWEDAADPVQWRADYESFIAFARPRVAEWAAEALTPADHQWWADRLARIAAFGGVA